MSQTIESKNKALVLEAFDTLFNKRDYVAAERYWSPNYIQHSAHIILRRLRRSSLPKTPSNPYLYYEDVGAHELRHPKSKRKTK